MKYDGTFDASTRFIAIVRMNDGKEKSLLVGQTHHIDEELIRGYKDFLHKRLLSRFGAKNILYFGEEDSLRPQIEDCKAVTYTDYCNDATLELPEDSVKDSKRDELIDGLVTGTLTVDDFLINYFGGKKF